MSTNSFGRDIDSQFKHLTFPETSSELALHYIKTTVGTGLVSDAKVLANKYIDALIEIDKALVERINKETNK